jgi:hypothetical protein
MAFFPALSLALLAAACAAQRNPRPVIGILSMPNTAYAKSHGYSQFPASYTKFLEAGGARVVPIPYDLAPAPLAALLASLNGALFTGGAAAFYSPQGELTPFAATAQAIFNASVAAAAAGEVWPLWGTCLGFELISVLAGGQAVLTPGWDSENYTATVAWAPEAASSRLWASADARAAFADAPLAFNAHTQGVAPAAFAAAPGLAGRFTALGTSVDRRGVPFVATMEGKPPLAIYATQWHPEKAVFEWPEDWTEYIPVRALALARAASRAATHPLTPPPTPTHPGPGARSTTSAQSRTAWAPLHFLWSRRARTAAPSPAPRRWTLRSSTTTRPCTASRRSLRPFTFSRSSSSSSSSERDWPAIDFPAPARRITYL